MKALLSVSFGSSISIVRRAGEAPVDRREPYYEREPNWSSEGVREREIVYVVVTPPPGL
jgi:hypothetical protein